MNREQYDNDLRIRHLVATGYRSHTDPEVKAALARLDRIENDRQGLDEQTVAPIGPSWGED